METNLNLYGADGSILAGLLGGASGGTSSGSGFDFNAILGAGVDIWKTTANNKNALDIAKATNVATGVNLTPQILIGMPQTDKSTQPTQPTQTTQTTKDGTYVGEFSITNADPNAKTNKKTWLYVGIGGGLLILAIIIFFVMKKKR